MSSCECERCSSATPEEVRAYLRHAFGCALDYGLREGWATKAEVLALQDATCNPKLQSDGLLLCAFIRDKQAHEESAVRMCDLHTFLLPDGDCKCQTPPLAQADDPEDIFP